MKACAIRLQVKCKVLFVNAICPGKIFFSEIKMTTLQAYASIRFEVSDIFNILLQANMLIYSSTLEGQATSDFITLKEPHWIFQVLFAWVDYNKQLACPSQIQVQIERTQ